MEAEFTGSYTKLSQCPKDRKPEYAFIGRSNVGKSSLINYLVGRKKLVKVSSTPGKTQTLNFFIIDKKWYMVDLPGYGYAKISKSQRKKWEYMIKEYLLQRQNLFYIFVLIDARIPPQEVDLEYLEWLAVSQLPFAVIFTKSEKGWEKSTDSYPQVEAFKEKLLEKWEELPPIFMSSALKKQGADEILAFIEETNKTFGHLLKD